jgi:hypothetical protein
MVSGPPLAAMMRLPSLFERHVSSLAFRQADIHTIENSVYCQYCYFFILTMQAFSIGSKATGSFAHIAISITFLASFSIFLFIKLVAVEA